MAETKSSRKPRERWLLTRKTWRYMTDAGRKLVPEHEEHSDIGILEQRFQELCSGETTFIAWEPSTSTKPYSWQKKDNDSSVKETIEPVDDDRPTVPAGTGTQTEESEFFEIDWKPRSRPQPVKETRLPEKETPARIEKETPAAAAANQNFSSAVMKYFGMGRKKTDKDKINRFKMINYDRSLRNIKSKNVNLDSTDEAANQSQDGFSRDTESSIAIQVGESQVRCVTASYKASLENVHRSVPRPVDLLDTRRAAVDRKKVNETPSPVILSPWNATSPVSEPGELLQSPACSITVSDDYGPCHEEVFAHLSSVDMDHYIDDHGSSEAELLLLVPGKGHSSRQIFFGENFSSTNPVPRVARQSLPVIHSPVPAKGSSRSTSTIACESSALLHAKRRSSLRVSTGKRKSSPLSHVASNLHLNHLISAVMQKSRSGSSLVAAPKENSVAAATATVSPAAANNSRVAGKILWKSRSKSQNRASASNSSLWTPHGSCKWSSSLTGRQIVLSDTTLLQLTDIERIALRKVALAKLQDLHLGVSLRPPPEVTSAADHKPKRRAQLLRKRGSNPPSNPGGEQQSGCGLVFGIPLDQCVANERRLRQQRNFSADSADDGTAVRKYTHVAARSQEKGDGYELSETERKRSCSFSNESGDGLVDESSVGTPCVPSILSACFQHLEMHGLNTVGIFRVSSSKKRVRQLREDFDCGNEVVLSEESSPHDVATLLKEFFRDLPEPLLTRSLYPAFVQTQRIRNRQTQLKALQHLVQLLPTANQDTLCMLLAFLDHVAGKSEDHRGPDGVIIPGNKMDTNNLATLFAPNILHAVRAGASPEEMARDYALRADERIDVINVVRTMIENHKQLFELPMEILDEAYLFLMETGPEALDTLLSRKCQSLNYPLTDDMESSSSVFEGSECSSVPRTPNFDTFHHSVDSLYSAHYARDDLLLDGGSHHEARLSAGRERHFFDPRSRERTTERHLVVQQETLEQSRPRSQSIIAEDPAVITASLRISVAASTADLKSFTVENDNDIPFIEDTSSQEELLPGETGENPRERVSLSPVKDFPTAAEISPARKRTGSSDSYLGYPGSERKVSTNTGSSRNQTKSGSHDSVISGTSYVSSPPQTPVTPVSTYIVSGTSSPLSYGCSSPPPSSPPPSPKPSRAEATWSAQRSKTAELHNKFDVKLGAGDKSKQDKGRNIPAPNRLGEASSRQSAKSGGCETASGRGQMTAVLRKKWEIMASNPSSSQN